MDNLKFKIKQMLVERLFLQVQPSQIGDDEPLMEAYNVDSVALLELAIGLEDEFGVSMEDKDFSVDYFRTVNAIAEVIEQRS